MVHTGVDAVYVETAGGCVGVLSRSAVRVPCGLVTDLAALPPPASLSAVIGTGRLVLGDLVFAPGRVLDLAVPVLSWDALYRLAHCGAGTDNAAAAELPAPALATLQEGNAAAVPELLGRGSGLTPVGDDVLCGWLATMAAAGRRESPIASAVRDTARGSTTTLSATLLDRAADGDVLPRFRRLLRIAATQPGRLERAATDLRAVGHTSGDGLLLGTTLAARAVTVGRSLP